MNPTKQFKNVAKCKIGVYIIHNIKYVHDVVEYEVPMIVGFINRCWHIYNNIANNKIILKL